MESRAAGRVPSGPARARSAARPPPATASPTRSSQAAAVPGQSCDAPSLPVRGGETIRVAALPAGGAGPTEKAMVPSVRCPSSAEITVHSAA